MSAPKQISSKLDPGGHPGCLSGLSFHIIGELPSLTRGGAHNLINKYGGKVAIQPDQTTNYAIIGDSPPSDAIKRVNDLSITQITEADLFDMIRTRIPPPTPSKPTPSQKSILSESLIALSVLAVIVPVICLGIFKAGQLPALPKNLEKTWIPDNAQVIRLQEYVVLDRVAPPVEAAATQLFVPPGHTVESLSAKPFHIYDVEFLRVIGQIPSLTLIASTESDPLFHEAPVWYPPTDEMFFCQNAGAPAAGTGLHKSAIIQKISMQEAERVRLEGKGEEVEVVRVDTDPMVINPNGGTNYRGQMVFCAEGQGDEITSALYTVNPVEPYNTTVILNNFHGRQFNSLNDIAVHPRNKDLYFTDVTYGYLQDFRPKPGMPNQVYRFSEKTGQVSVVADGFDKCNGITFSPDGKYAYVTDTGASGGPVGKDFSQPSAIYRFTVQKDGTWENRKLFAQVTRGAPDGIHCDTQGNVYAGIGDGVAVWNPSGKLLGKIFLGAHSANFQFAGASRMIILSETKLFYVVLGAAGADITDL